MGGFFNFCRSYPLPAIGIGLGAIVNIYGFISAAYEAIQFGFPPMAWACVGAAAFFISVVTLLYRAQGHAPKALAKPASGNGDHLKIIHDRFFSRCEVPLDGMHYVRCTFDNVTFVFEGNDFFSFEQNKVGSFEIRTSEKFENMLLFMVNLNVLKTDVRTPTGVIDHEQWLKHVGTKFEGDVKNLTHQSEVSNSQSLQDAAQKTQP